MTTLKKLLMCLYGILIVFAAMGIQLVVFGMMEYPFILGGRPVTDEVRYLFSVIGILVCGIIFFLWYRGTVGGEDRISVRRILGGRNLLWIIALGIGCQFLVSGLLSLIQPFFDETFSDYNQTIDNLFRGNIIVVVILTVIIAPITEELIFRGMVMGSLKTVISSLGANIFQAAAFGLYHMNLVQGIYAFILGLILGSMALRFHSVKASILLHMAVNASAYLLMILPSHNATLVLTIAIGTILLVAGLMGLRERNLIDL